MRLLVTRPEPDGESTAAKLRAKGHEVFLAPLLQVKPIDADIGSGPWGAVVITSVNALRAAERHLSSLLMLPVFAVGRRTAEAARAAGFVEVMSADGDVGDLARVITARRGIGAPLLHLAGEDRAGDLAGELAGVGVNVQTVVVYHAVMAGAFPSDVRDALVSGRIDSVLHFSRRSAESYLTCARTGGILAAALAPLHHCLSQAVAEPLAAAGATRIRVAERPNEAALLEVVEVQ